MFDNLAKGQSVDHWLKVIEAAARRRLEEAGLPVTLGRYVVEQDGRWRARDDEDEPVASRSYVRHPALIDQKKMTLVGMSADILSRTSLLRLAIEERLYDAGVVDALRLGMKVEQAEFVERWEVLTLRGRKNLRDTRDGQRVARRSIVHDQASREVRELHEKRPNRSIRAICSQIANKHDLKVESLRKAYRRQQKMGTRLALSPAETG